MLFPFFISNPKPYAEAIWPLDGSKGQFILCAQKKKSNPKIKNKILFKKTCKHKQKYV